MFLDDVSEIPTSGCTTINSKTVIYNYSNNIRRTYTEVGGKWVYTAQATYTSLPNNVVCVDLSEYALSSYAYMQPVYMFIALSVALFVICSCFFVMFGRFLKWRL